MSNAASTNVPSNAIALHGAQECRALLECRAPYSPLLPVVYMAQEGNSSAGIEHDREIRHMLDERDRVSSTLMALHRNLEKQMEQIAERATAAEREEISGAIAVDPANAAANVWLIAREQGTQPVVADAVDQLRLFDRLQEARTKEVVLQARRMLANELLLRSGQAWSDDAEAARALTALDKDEAISISDSMLGKFLP